MKTAHRAVGFPTAACGLLLAWLGGSVDAQPLSALRPTNAGAYAEYDLRAPSTGGIRLTYDVTAPRRGLDRVEAAVPTWGAVMAMSAEDAATGASLPLWHGHSPAEGGESVQIRVSPRPAVDAVRVRIGVDLHAPQIFKLSGSGLLFSGRLTSKHVTIVLPKGYRLRSANYPMSIAQRPDGRTALSFFNVLPVAAPVEIRAERASGEQGAAAVPSQGPAVSEDRDIVYALRAPETHTFDLFHDYTEVKAGVARYVNGVRPGSAAANASAINLDTGETLQGVLLRGDAITKAGIDDPELGQITPQTEVVVFPFAPVPKGGSVRLRMTETYSDTVRYQQVGDELIFQRPLRRSVNAIILPVGWTLTASSEPVFVSRTPDGRDRLDYENSRQDEMDVEIHARRRSAQP